MIECNPSNPLYIKEIIGEVFDLAEWDVKTSLACNCVCKLWEEVFSAGTISVDKLKTMFPTLFIFGANEWEKHFGEIDKVPAILSRKIVQILNSPCPFTLETLTGNVADTHLLVWCPRSVGGKLRTINSMRDLAQSPLQGYATKYHDIWSGVVEQYGDVPAKSQWIFLTADILKGSRNISYDKQEKMVTDQPEYEMPTVLNAITAVIVRYVATGEYTFGGNFGGNPATYMQCSEKVKYLGYEFQITVGHFNASGLHVGGNRYDILCCAVAAGRVF